MRTRSLLCALGALAAVLGLEARLLGFGLGDLRKAVDSAVPNKNATKLIDTVDDNKEDGARIWKGYKGIGIDEECAIGGSVAIEIVGTYGGLVRDEEINRRVNLIGRTLAGCSDRPTLAWRFGVLDSDTINAFSAPGGYVFITRGLYALAADDDQLAGILGHEIAHVTKRHALKIVEDTEKATGIGNIAVRENSTAGQADALLQKLDLGVGKVLDTLLKSGYTPATEYEADHVGRDLAALSGYSRDGLKLVLQRLKQGNLAQPKKIFSTHPPLDKRISRL